MTGVERIATRVRKCESIEGTHTFTRTRTRESPKPGVGIEGKEI